MSMGERWCAKGWDRNSSEAAVTGSAMRWLTDCGALASRRGSLSLRASLL